MGEKIWLSIHPRNFGSDKIVRPSVCPRLHDSVRSPMYVLSTGCPADQCHMTLSRAQVLKIH